MEMIRERTIKGERGEAWDAIAIDWEGGKGKGQGKGKGKNKTMDVTTWRQHSNMARVR